MERSPAGRPLKVITLTLTGSITTANTISGIIGNGGAAGGVALSKTSSGTWTLSGLNADGLPDGWQMAKVGALSHHAASEPDGGRTANRTEPTGGTDPPAPLANPGVPLDPSKPTGLMVDRLAFLDRIYHPGHAAGVHLDLQSAGTR